MPTYLNDPLRSQIAHAAVTPSLAKEAASIADRYRGLAAFGYRSVTSTDAEDKLLMSLPNGWFTTMSEIRLREGKTDHIVSFNGVQRYSQYRKYLAARPDISHRFPCGGAYTYFSVTGLKQLMAEEEDFNEKAADLLADVRHAMQPFRTVEKLVEAWPEIVPFIPAAQQRATLPAPRFEVLNGKLGLKKETK